MHLNQREKIFVIARTLHKQIGNYLMLLILGTEIKTVDARYFSSSPGTSPKIVPNIHVHCVAIKISTSNLYCFFKK